MTSIRKRSNFSAVRSKMRAARFKIAAVHWLHPPTPELLAQSSPSELQKWQKGERDRRKPSEHGVRSVAANQNVSLTCVRICTDMIFHSCYDRRSGCSCEIRRA